MREAHERKSRNNGLYLAAANAHTCKFSHLILLPHCSIMKIHLLHPFHPCRLSPHRLRTPKTWYPRHPPGSPPSPQSNRWNISVQSCQISTLPWTCGFRCLHLHPPLLQTGSVLLTHTHTHSLQPAATDHAATHEHIRTETLAIWQQLLGFWPLLPANPLPYSGLSHSLPLSARSLGCC